MFALLAVAIAPSLGRIVTWSIDRPSEPSRPLLVRVTYPMAGSKLPVIIFSHGLGGSKDAYQPLATYWAEHGYVVLQPTHGDSGVIRLGRANATQGFKYWNERPVEVSMIIDALPKLNAGPELNGRMDVTRIGMGGHSFGAHTTQIVAGTKLAPMASSKTLSDPRPLAFLMISPQGPGPLFQQNAWADIKRPVLMVSGDNDSSPIGGQTPESRMKVWEGFSPGDKYLLWVKDAYHGFGGITGHIPVSGIGPMDDKQVQTVQEISTAFWDAYLKGDRSARALIQGSFAEAPAGHSLTHK